MRHKIRRLQLNRFTSWREATLASLARNMLIHQRIKTTVQRAKAARPLIERLISFAKENTLSAKRQAVKILNDHELVSMLFNEIGPRFAKREGGFTRIIPLGVRRGDDAKMAIFELTEIKEKKTKKAKKTKAEKTPEETNVEKTTEEKRPEAKAAPEKEKPPVMQKPTKKFLGGIRNIFKKERDAL